MNQVPSSPNPSPANNSPRKTGKTILIVLLVLIVLAALVYSGLFSFNLIFAPPVLLIGGVVTFVILRRRPPSGTGQSSSVISGIVLAGLGMVGLVGVNYAHFLKPGGAGGDVLEPLLYLIGLVLTFLVYAAGLLVMFAAKGVTGKLQKMRIFFLLITALAGLASPIVFGRIQADRIAKAAAERQQRINTSIPQAEAIKVAETQLHPKVNYKFDGATNENGTEWAIYYRMTNRAGKELDAGFYVDVDAHTGKIIPDPVDPMTDFVVTRSGVAVSDLEVYSIVLDESGSGYSYPTGIIDYAITTSDGTVKMHANLNSLNYLAILENNQLKVYHLEKPATAGPVKVDLSKPAAVTVKDSLWLIFDDPTVQANFGQWR